MYKGGSELYAKIEQEVELCQKRSCSVKALWKIDGDVQMSAYVSKVNIYITDKEMLIVFIRQSKRALSSRDWKKRPLSGSDHNNHPL